jgi:transcriptional regulator with XRE-family HTH domain
MSKQLRLKLNLSLAEFAAVAGVDRNTVWRWERYGQRPRARAIRDRLAELEREAETPEGRAAIIRRVGVELARQRNDPALLAVYERRARELSEAPA